MKAKHAVSRTDTGVLVNKGRVMGDYQARFYEGLGGEIPRVYSTGENRATIEL